MCQNQSLSCPGGGGWGGGGGGGWGGGGKCGDGVLQMGEECDVVGAPWCNACNINMTNPGANPVTSVWMTIPRLANARLGQSWDNALPFSDVRMVVGQGTRLFTLADTVGFGMKTEYRIPLMIPYDKVFCLSSTGSVLNSERVCTTIGEAVRYIGNGVQIFERPTDGKKYVVLGAGDFQYQEKIAGPYFIGTAHNTISTVNLFKGSDIYTLRVKWGNLTLRDAFIGKDIGADGTILLGTDAYDFLQFPVRVSGAIVWAFGTPVNRNIENFLGIQNNLLKGFIRDDFQTTTSLNTTSANGTNTSSIVNLNVPINVTGTRSVKNITELEALSLNGNKNILAIKGNLTIEGCVDNLFKMSGVRTVLVEDGNLTLKCNTQYVDENASWAWIVKGGNIQIYGGTTIPGEFGVTNLWGVYVAIPGNTNTPSGQFQSSNGPSQKILKIDGSLYGDASPLFSSRLYARGTNAYDILTTGTIISYSNRALVNPPPLLSQYLNSYQVTRVVK
jgi:hypothetical protein